MQTTQIGTELSTINLKLDPSGKRIVARSPSDKFLLGKATGKVFLHATGADYLDMIQKLEGSHYSVVMDQADLERFL